MDLTEYNDLSYDLAYSNYSPHHYSHYEEYEPHHMTHPELDHHFDHYHDVNPFEFHEHAVLPAFEYGKRKNDYYGVSDFERAAAK